MGCYIAPNYALTIEDVIAAIRRRPRGAKLLVADGFNVDLADPERTTCAYETAVEIADQPLPPEAQALVESTDA